MKRNWEYKKLGDVCEILNGYAFKSQEYVDHGIRVIRITNVQKGHVIDDDPKFYPLTSESSLSNYMLVEDDLLMSLTGNVGRVGLLGKEFLPAALNQRVACLRIRSASIDKKFLFHILNSDKFEKDCIFNASGIAQKNMSTRWLGEYVIPVPPLEEQSRIVAELDLLTGIIDKQNAQLKELDSLAQSIFYDMFGDPIENPKRWEVKKLGDVSTSVSYGTSSPSSTVGKYKYLRMNNITYEGFLDLTDLKYIDMDDAEFEKYSVREGDVLFNRTNSMDLIGKTTYIHNMEPMIIAGYIIRVRLVDSVLPVYVSKFMNMPAMKKKLKGMAKGAVNQANINSKELKSIDIPLPPLALQQSFAEKIQSIEKQKETIRASIADTQKLLDYTMDKYFG